MKAITLRQFKAEGHREGWMECSTLLHPSGFHHITDVDSEWHVWESLSGYRRTYCAHPDRIVYVNTANHTPLIRDGWDVVVRHMLNILYKPIHTRGQQAILLA